MLQFKKVKELSPDNIKETICYTDKLLSTKKIKMSNDQLVSLIQEVADLFRSQGVSDSNEKSAYLVYSRPDNMKNHLEILQNEDNLIDELEIPDFIHAIKIRSV